MMFLRSNPDARLDVVLDAVRAVDPRLAELMAKYPSTVEPFLGKIEEKLRAKGLLKVPVPVAPAAPERPKKLTDREAWTRLAALVPSALAHESPALQAALVAEFEAEASRAAG